MNGKGCGGGRSLTCASIPKYTWRPVNNPSPPDCDAAVPSTPLQFSRLRNNGFKILTAMISRWRPSAMTPHNLADKYQRFRETCYIPPYGSNDLKTEVARLLEDICQSTRPHGVHCQSTVPLILTDIGPQKPFCNYSRHKNSQGGEVEKWKTAPHKELKDAMRWDFRLHLGPVLRPFAWHPIPIYTTS